MKESEYPLVATFDQYTDTFPINVSDGVGGFLKKNILGSNMSLGEVKKKYISLNLNTAADQSITLTGGNLFNIVDIVLYNPSPTVSGAQDLQFINTLGSNEVILIGSHLGPFTLPYAEFDGLDLINGIDSCLSFKDLVHWRNSMLAGIGGTILPQVLVQSPFVARVGTVQGSDIIVDCIIYYNIIS